MLRTSSVAIVAAGVLAFCVSMPLFAQGPLPAASAEDRALGRAILKELIEINTTDTPRGNVTAGTEAMRKRLLDAGFASQDIELLGPDPRKQNLVVRIHADGRPTGKPILFLCHMDVVEALRSDWTTDPF